jgi:hypothetical protein
MGILNLEIKQTKKIVAHQPYKAVQIYDEDFPQFNYYQPTQSGDFYMVDCWVIDKNGNKHPGIDVCPVPIDVDDLDTTQ